MTADDRCTCRAKLRAAEKVAEAARGYFQHHVSEAPHGTHVERVMLALARYENSEKQEDK